MEAGGRERPGVLRGRGTGGRAKTLLAEARLREPFAQDWHQTGRDTRRIQMHSGRRRFSRMPCFVHGAIISGGEPLYREPAASDKSCGVGLAERDAQERVALHSVCRVKNAWRSSR